MLYLGSLLTGKENQRGAETCHLSFPIYRAAGLFVGQLLTAANGIEEEHSKVIILLPIYRTAGLFRLALLTGKENRRGAETGRLLLQFSRSGWFI
jgi:hypothetical protein